MTIVLSLLVAGAAAGIIAGLLGVGGGIVTVPVLYQLLSYLDVEPEVRMHVAVASSLALIIPTSLRSVLGHHKRGAVDLNFLKAWSVWIILGSALGALLSGLATDKFLRLFFGCIALGMALIMSLTRDEWSSGFTAPEGWLRQALATLVGTVSTLMGIGGGAFGVPLLVLYGEPIRRAVGTAAGFGLLISIPGSIGAVIAGWQAEGLPTASLGYVNLAALAVLTPMTLLTTPLGVRLAHSLPPLVVRRLFALFMLLVAARMLSP